MRLGPVALERADIVIDDCQYGGHHMLTLGCEQAGVRATMGRLTRHGRWRPRLPDVFVLWRGRRRSLR